MKLVEWNNGIETYEYENSQERNDHINSYARMHTLCGANGDGVNSPLTAKFMIKND